jgi:tungstate transport system substrate-binding protein
MEWRQMNQRFAFKMLQILILAIVISACWRSPEATPPISDDNPDSTQDIILATTTSTQDSGLLDELIPVFEELTGYIVKTVAVGTGKALKMAEEGNADVLFVHAPSAEQELMDKGYGIERELIMHNDFVIVGPPEDPAEIKGISDVGEACKKIATSGAAFTSRGDDSGTHKKELAIWEDAGITPEGDWYLESGQGMGATLRIASEKGTYTLTDRATFLANKEILASVILNEGDPILLNIYHVITVNPDKWPNVNIDGARAFMNFLMSPETQEMIEEFGIEEFGQPLFFPDAGKSESDLGLP